MSKSVIPNPLLFSIFVVQVKDWDEGIKWDGRRKREGEGEGEGKPSPTTAVLNFAPLTLKGGAKILDSNSAF